jgi:hypothetical protein
MKFGLFYCDDEISFILHMSSKTVGLDTNFKLSNFWLWGGREGQDGVHLLWVLRCLLLCFFLNVLSSWESAVKLVYGRTSLYVCSTL